MPIKAVLPMKRGDDWKLNVGSIPAGNAASCEYVRMRLFGDVPFAHFD
jgi:hypothetical protein